MDEFDYIIVGAGSAGCVLANRLSADPKTRVLVLEAGGKDNWIWYHIPVGYLFALGNPRADWMYRIEGDKGLNGRTINYPRGRVIGGSSSINAMIYMRGQSTDYDNWRQLGLSGWGWDDVLPLFKKSEDHIDGANEFHGAGGDLRVEGPRIFWPILAKVRDAAQELGIPKVEDFNTGSNEGSSYFQVTQKMGRRWSAARGFLKPALKARPNLKLITGVMVDKVTIENGRATGVRYSLKGEFVTANARGEVILSAGSINTPQILELSGIGRADVLQNHGIEIVHQMNGVGENLQDHLQLRPMYKVENAQTLNMDYQNLFKRAKMGWDYALFRRGPMTMAPSQLGIFTRSSSEFEMPNVQFHVQPLSLPKFGDPLHKFPAITVSVCNLRPTSRGTVHITSNRSSDAPKIAPNYLSTTSDQHVAADSIRLARRLMDAPSMKPFNPQEFFPGLQAQTEAELVKAAGDIGSTIFHPVGTAKMGRMDDTSAVVDERLRVIGLQGLRVVDASIMPSIVSGNTNAPSIMIGEKGAQMILEDNR